MPALIVIEHATGPFWITMSKDLGTAIARWRRNFAQPASALPSQMAAISTDVTDWKLAVVRELPRLSSRRLERARDFVIEGLRAAGQPVLNPPPTKPEGPHATPSSSSLLWVLDAGTRITLREAATMLGCLPQTLTKRLRNFRKRNPGRKVVTIDELAEASQRARSRWRNTPSA